MAIIDWEQFNENFQYYDKETIGLVIENFLEESDDRLCKMEKNISDRDFENLSFNSHSFKSVIGNFMAPKPYDVCRNLEELAKQKVETDLHVIFSELKTLTNGLKSELIDYKKKNL